MKKHVLSLVLLLSFVAVKAQFDYKLTGKNDAPSLGFNWGFVGGGYTSMLNNRDDITADKRLDPQFMNFNWAAGVEGLYWFQENFGFGGQLLYWNAGAKYTGEDTLTKIKLSATTKMTYVKLPVLFHFKSYNRYYPNRRTRLSVLFGPYVALLTGYSDDGTYKNENGDEVGTFGVDGNNYEQGNVKGKLNGEIYNPIDLGFVFGIGGEIRLWKRTIIALNIRTDVGISNVENTKSLKITYDGQTEKQDFNYWNGFYSKYHMPTAEDIANGWEPNRRATKNFSVGAFLSVRKYF